MCKANYVKTDLVQNHIVTTTCDSCRMESEVPVEMIPYQEKLEQMSKKILRLTDEVKKWKDLYKNISANYTIQCSECGEKFHSKKEKVWCMYCRTRCVAL